jgi:uncharacterized protein YbaP (TraB family)
MTRPTIAHVMLLSVLLGIPIGLRAAPPTAADTATSAPSEESPGGLLWRVSDGKRSSLLLLGSVHVQRATDLPLPAAVSSAYEKSSLLVLELDTASISPGELERALRRFGTAPPTRPLRSVLGPDYPRTRDQLTALGYAPAQLEQYDPWFVSTAVVNEALSASGYQAELGVEALLTRRAGRDRRDVRGLETIEEQLAVLDALDGATQRRMLVESLTELESIDSLTAQVVDAWRASDVPALRAALATPFDGQEALYGALVSARNRRWVPSLLALLETPETELVVVGALHVVGSDSVVALLREEGLRVEAIW